jgi:hypothetical protein
MSCPDSNQAPTEYESRTLRPRHCSRAEVGEQRATTTSSTASHTNTVQGVPLCGFRNLICRNMIRLLGRGIGRPHGLYFHWTTQQNKKFWEELIGSGKLLLAFAKSFLVLGPVGLITIFFWPTTLESCNWEIFDTTRTS